jgi:hypothetical protein
MRWRDELDALTFDSVSRMIAGGIVLGGLVGAALVGTGALGEERSSVTAARSTPVVETAQRSPVCLRVDPSEAGLGTTLEAAVLQAFPTAGEGLFEGWPQKVGDAWRWDRDTPAETGVASEARVGAATKDARGVAWSQVVYDLEPDAASSTPTQGLRLVVPRSYVEGGPPSAGLASADDPATIPPGATLVLDDTVLEPTTLDRYAGAVPGDSATDLALAVTPTGPDRVVVSVGTTSAVVRAALLWPGVDRAHADLDVDESTRDFTMRQAVLDLGSDDGRRAYRELLRGAVPTEETDGVQDVAVVRSGRYATARVRQLEGDGLTVAPSFFAEGLDRAVREDADGSVTLTRSVVSGDDRLRFGEVFDRAGRSRGVQGQVRVPDVAPAAASAYNRSFAGSPAEVSGAVALVLDLDARDIATIRSDAMDVAADWFNSDSDGKRFAKDVLRLTGLASSDDVVAWLREAQPALVDRVATTMGGDQEGTPDRAAADVMRAISTERDDAWSTYVAFTNVVAGQAKDTATALAQWGEAVQRGSRATYSGFGDATCTSLG